MSVITPTEHLVLRLRLIFSYLALAAFAATSPMVHAAKAERGIVRPTVNPDPRADGEAEARLIAIYRLIGDDEIPRALAAAEQLTHDYPQFQLGQLVYGDLLTSKVRPLRMLGDLPDGMPHDVKPLDDLRLESAMRLKALRERPPAGTVPMQFVRLAASSRHAIAVDASRSRIYLMENSADGLKLIADYYVSVGKEGVEKFSEGDMRTPLGVYYIIRSLDPRTLRDIFGVGALTLNYPNPLDARMGKTGSGIWLHGTPAQRFSRPPMATDGCVAMANPDLERILRTVEIRKTPVVIARHLQWVAPDMAGNAGKSFESAFNAWRLDKSSGNFPATMSFYTRDFKASGKSEAGWSKMLRDDVDRFHTQNMQIGDLSFIHFADEGIEAMVVTLSENTAKGVADKILRQYWLHISGKWEIAFEGEIG